MRKLKDGKILKRLAKICLLLFAKKVCKAARETPRGRVPGNRERQNKMCCFLPESGQDIDFEALILISDTFL